MAEAAVRKRALQDFYNHYTGQCPADDKLDGILSKYEADEGLYTALCSKYKLNEAEVTERRRRMRRLEDFYAQYAPDSVAKVSGLMKKVDDFDGLLDALRTKYKVSAAEFPNVANASKKKAAPAPPPAPVAETPAAAPEPAAPSPSPPIAEKAAAPAPTAAEQSSGMDRALTRVSAGVTLTAQQRVREQAMLVRETAIKALEAAVEAKLDALAVVPPERAAPWSKPADVSLEINNQFLTHLASIEQQLLKKSCELSCVEATIGDREAAVMRAEEILTAKSQQLEDEFEAFKATRIADAQQRAALSAALEERQRFYEKQMPSLERREAALNEREADVDAKLHALSDREAAVKASEITLKAQLAAANEERELAKRLSEEVLKREATVRVVEKSLNQARVELTNLEEDLASRTRKLLADETSLRSWAEEVDRKETKLLAVLEQLKQKGIVISGL